MDENNHRPQQGLPKRMALLAWVALFVVFFLFFDEQIENRFNPNQTPEAIHVGDTIELKLKQNRSGHYVVNGTINGQPVVYLLDTGATTVTIPGHLADRLNLVPGYPQTVSTANGNRTVYRTTAEILTIDKIILYNVAANLNDGMTGDYILLGMSALKQLDFKQSDGWLYLSQSN